ncbi:GAF domain-containing protein [Microbacterium sp. NPDC091676]|uniref:GAF domain-containing protein n=1 Tax=Microbacterium sp. NPDC091676 TaxID=3364212 RepID=UPI0037F2FBCD
MLRAIGAVLDRVWPHAVAIVGALVLALSPLFLDHLRTWGAHIGADDWIAAAVLVLASVAAGGGVIFGAWRYERATVQGQAELMVAVRSSLVPAANHFIRLPRPVTDAMFEDAITELTARCQLFAKKDNDSPDANVYLLERGRLVRVNRSAGNARAVFETIARGRPADVVAEERQVIERVKGGVAAICTDVRSKKHRRELRLADVERSYRSFISLPILREDGSPLGMISLNSSRKRGLGELHVRYLTSIAVLVAALEAARAS